MLSRETDDLKWWWRKKETAEQKSRCSLFSGEPVLAWFDGTERERKRKRDGKQEAAALICWGVILAFGLFTAFWVLWIVMVVTWLDHSPVSVYPSWTESSESAPADQFNFNLKLEFSSTFNMLMLNNIHIYKRYGVICKKNMRNQSTITRYR